MAGKGGYRPNAGRKSNAFTQLKRNFAASLLSDKREGELWKKALDSKNEKVALDALKSLTEHKYGKAIQRNENSGPEGEPMEVRVRVDI
jgi:hypothetical protein